jgi:dephospho-CoA kinase
VNRCHGLTGGIGSGKSTVAQQLGELGARVVDTDEISHQLTARDGLALPAIRQTFGTEYIMADGALDRTHMRKLIFGNPDAKQRLQDILHPLILAQAKVLAAAPTTAPYTLVVVPLLFESGCYRDWLQRVIVVDCPESEQIRRTMLRSGLDEPAVRAIMAQQIERAARLRLADEIIRNDGDLNVLKIQVSQLHQRLLTS